jgi:hypothetical protein
MSYATKHVTLAGFLNTAGDKLPEPEDKAVQALVWQALQRVFEDNEVATLPYSAPNVQPKERLSEIKLQVLNSFLFSGSLHLAVLPEYGLLLANMAAVRNVAQAKGGPAFLFSPDLVHQTRWSLLVTSMVGAGLTVAKIHFIGEHAEIELVR